MRAKSRNITIITLIIIILLCLVAIACLAYALFNLDDYDGRIGINVVSGKCQIDIVDTKDTSLVGGILDIVSKEQKVYFEPGATYYTEGFEIQNTGNIPVNIRMYVSNDDGIDMEAFKEAFELLITNDTENLDTAEKLTSFEERLEVGEKTDTYYLVIKMREEAGNEFQDKSYTGIGVTVYAVQGNAEVRE